MLDTKVFTDGDCNSNGIWCSVVWQICVDVSEEPAASIIFIGVMMEVAAQNSWGKMSNDDSLSFPQNV